MSTINATNSTSYIKIYSDYHKNDSATKVDTKIALIDEQDSCKLIDINYQTKNTENSFEVDRSNDKLLNKMQPATMMHIGNKQAQIELMEDKLEKEQEEKVREKARKIMDEFNTQDLGLSFRLDRDYDTTVISVMDKSTDDLVRQIPSEEFLKFAQKIDELCEQNKSKSMSEFHPDKDEIKGLLFDEKA